VDEAKLLQCGPSEVSNLQFTVKVVGHDKITVISNRESL
jgi:hypothetical protein